MALGVTFALQIEETGAMCAGFFCSAARAVRSAGQTVAPSSSLRHSLYILLIRKDIS